MSFEKGDAYMMGQTGRSGGAVTGGARPSKRMYCMSLIECKMSAIVEQMQRDVIANIIRI